MAVAVNQADFLLEPVGAVGLFLPRTVRRSAASKGGWIPLFDSQVSDDDIKNIFMAEITFNNLHGMATTLSFCVCGGEKIDDVCSSCFKKLRDAGRLGPNPVSCVFRTVEEMPLVISTGALMAEIYKTNPSDNGVGVQLSGTVVELKDDRYCITPPGEDLILGGWMNAILLQ